MNKEEYIEKWIEEKNVTSLGPFFNGAILGHDINSKIYYDFDCCATILKDLNFSKEEIYKTLKDSRGFVFIYPFKIPK